MKRQTRRRRQTLRRRRQRGGGKRGRAALLFILVWLLSRFRKASSESLYELGTDWWKDGTFENSKRFADGIVKAFEGAPADVAERVTQLVNSIRSNNPKKSPESETGAIRSRVPTAEPGYTWSPPALPVKPTKLPPSVVSNVNGVTVGETYMFVPKDGGETVTAMIMEHTELGNWHSIPAISPSKWDDYTVYGPLPPEKEDDEDFGGKRRKPRRKTIRRKK